MTASTAEPRSWSRTWMSLVTAFLFAVQLALIFWLSDWRPLTVRPPAPAPAYHLLGNAPDPLLELANPTLFSLPQPQGFSGAAWLRVPRLEPQPIEWSEAPRWLQFDASQLAGAFYAFAATNQTGGPALTLRMDPAFFVSSVAPASLARAESRCRLEGGLANRRMLTRPDLPAWPSGELLTNSIVQLTVDGQGQPVSWTLVPPGSGLPAADAHALQQARLARFEPLPGTGSGTELPPVNRLRWGVMIFEWAMVALPSTNGTASK